MLPQFYVEPDMRIISTLEARNLSQHIFRYVFAHGDDRFYSAEFLEYFSHLTFQVQAVVEDDICFRKSLKVAMRCLVEVRIDSWSPQRDNFCMLYGDGPRRAGDRPCRCHDLSLRARLAMTTFPPPASRSSSGDR